MVKLEDELIYPLVDGHLSCFQFSPLLLMLINIWHRCSWVHVSLGCICFAIELMSQRVCVSSILLDVGCIVVQSGCIIITPTSCWWESHLLHVCYTAIFANCSVHLIFANQMDAKSWCALWIIGVLLSHTFSWIFREKCGPTLAFAEDQSLHEVRLKEIWKAPEELGQEPAGVEPGPSSSCEFQVCTEPGCRGESWDLEQEAPTFDPGGMNWVGKGRLEGLRGQRIKDLLQSLWHHLF